MAQRKRPGRSPQAQDGQKSVGSRPDRRGRRTRLNSGRQPTARARVSRVGMIGDLIAAMSRLLDARMAFRLPILVAGAMLATPAFVPMSFFSCADVMIAISVFRYEVKTFLSDNDNIDQAGTSKRRHPPRPEFGSVQCLVRLPSHSSPRNEF